MNQADARTRLAAALAGNPHADYDAAAAIAFAEEADEFAMNTFRLKYGNPGEKVKPYDRETFDDVMYRLAHLLRMQAHKKRWRGMRNGRDITAAYAVLHWWQHVPDGPSRDWRTLFAEFHDQRWHERALWAAKVLDGAAARAGELFMAKLAEDIRREGL